jgi:HSP20 family protein
MAKGGFFSKLTGQSDDYGEYLDELEGAHAKFEGTGEERRAQVNAREESFTPDDAGGELAVDVYQTPEAIVVKAFIAAVQPASVDISLTREMLTISGQRQDEREVDEDDYFQRELFWGSFSRTILLPEEVDVDMAEASEKHGILMIRLPKINKGKQTKLKVRSR